PKRILRAPQSYFFEASSNALYALLVSALAPGVRLMSKPTPPAGLESAGQELWVQIVDKYDLRPDELVTLEDICAATDLIQVLELEWRANGKPLITTGSMGQEVEHPIIGSIDKQRKARNALWRQLKLPDDPGVTASEPNQHRQAAQSRWAAAHGQGA